MGCPDGQPYFFPQLLWSFITESWGRKGFGNDPRGHKKGVRIKIQPRFKIQYPMKNRDKDIR